MSGSKRLTGLGLLLIGLAVTGAALSAAEQPAAYGVEVEIVPSAKYAGAFEARAVVTDLVSEETVAAPRVVFRRGPEGRGQIKSGSFDGPRVEIEVEVDEAGERAVCRVEIHRGERLLSVTRVEVRLPGDESIQ